MVTALLLTTACSGEEADPQPPAPEPVTYGDLPARIDYVALGDSFTWTHVRAAVNFHRMSVGEAPYRSRRAKNRDANEIVDLQLYDPALTPDLVPEFSRTRPMLGFLEVPADAWLRQGEQKRTDADLLAWLTDGDAPIYWGFGSMRIADPDGMARTFARVCAERGRRGLIVAGWSDLVGADLGDSSYVWDPNAEPEQREMVFKRLMQWGMSIVVGAPLVAWAVLVVPTV